MQIASKGSRVGAFIVDSLIIDVLAGIFLSISIYLGMVFGLCGMILYYGFFEGSKMHATLGKKIMGICVVDENGNYLDYGTSFIRALCRLLSGLVLSIGYWIGLFDDEGKSLHDRIARTRVVKAVPVNQPVRTPLNQPVQSPAAPGRVGRNVQIVGVSGRYAGKNFPLSEAGLIFGTDSTICNIVFPMGTPGISRRHCKAEFNAQSGMVILHDLNSSYGTYGGNHNRILPGQPLALQNGERFYLADGQNSFYVSIQ